MSLGGREDHRFHGHRDFQSRKSALLLRLRPEAARTGRVVTTTTALRIQLHHVPRSMRPRQGVPDLSAHPNRRRRQHGFGCTRTRLDDARLADGNRSPRGPTLCAAQNTKPRLRRELVLMVRFQSAVSRHRMSSVCPFSLETGASLAATQSAQDARDSFEQALEPGRISVPHSVRRSRRDNVLMRAFCR